MNYAGKVVTYEGLLITWEGHIIVIIHFRGMCFQEKNSHSNYQRVVEDNALPQNLRIYTVDTFTKYTTSN